MVTEEPGEAGEQKGYWVPETRLYQTSSEARPVISLTSLGGKKKQHLSQSISP